MELVRALSLTYSALGRLVVFRQVLVFAQLVEGRVAFDLSFQCEARLRLYPGSVAGVFWGRDVFLLTFFLCGSSEFADCHPRLVSSCEDPFSEFRRLCLNCLPVGNELPGCDLRCDSYD